MNKALLLLVALLCAGLVFIQAKQNSAGQPSSSAIAIVGATVIDGTGAEPNKQTVVLRGDRIEAVGAQIKPPPGARVINAEGMTLLPGLFDLHTHLPYASTGGVSGDWPKNLKAYLYCGVTSVNDFGTYPETFAPMRELIASGAVIGPRISLAARLTTPGGHGAEGGRGDFFSLEVSTAREARAAIQRVLPYRPDVIKVFTDGWRYGAAPDMTSMNEETLTALVDEAHQHKLKVLTHTVSLNKAKIAARAGVDVLAHGVGDANVDDELLRLMKTKGTGYVSTLAVYEPRGRDVLTPLLNTTLDAVALNATNPPLTDASDDKPAGIRALELANDAELAKRTPQLRRWKFLLNNIAALKKGGVALGAGTDAGVTGTHHGWATLRELELLVAGGLTPLEAITAATGVSARLIAVDGERGRVAPGKLADLVLVAGQPHKNIAEIEKIKTVFLGGRELDRDKLAREIAAPTLTELPAVKAQELIDDFEGGNGRSRPDRSSIDTLWVNSTDAGVDPSKMVFGRIVRAGGDHALSISARMSSKERPAARINVPLTRGAVQPADARAFRGVRFDVRGEGDYRLLVPTYRVRDFNYFAAPFQAGAQWQTVSIDFASLKQGGGRAGATNTVTWSGDDLLMLSFEMARPAGAFAWLELDNVRFYR